jgi:hypothetical protein
VLRGLPEIEPPAARVPSPVSVVEIAVAMQEAVDVLTLVEAEV